MRPRTYRRHFPDDWIRSKGTGLVPAGRQLLARAWRFSKIFALT